MRHTAVIAATLVILLALATPARAGMVEDCVQSRDPNLGIGGCTAVIRSGEYSGKNLAVAYFNRGIAYDDLGEHRRAIEDYSQALRFDPSYAFAYNNRGIAYYNLADYRRAIEDFDQALRIDSGYAKAYNNRGNAYDKLGEYRRAIRDYDQALRINPGYVTARTNRTNTQNRLDRRGEASRQPGSPSSPDASIRELEAAKARERRWDERTRRGVQNALMWTGDYNARLDGDFGPMTRKGIRNFQSRNGYASTGYLTAAQIESLESLRLAAIDYVGFRIVDELETGIRVGIPERIFRAGVRDGAFLEFKSASGFPFSALTLVSFPGDRDDLSALYYQNLLNLTDGKSAYRVLRDDWFVVSHEEGDIRFYSYGMSDGWAVKGFMLFWPSSESRLFEPVSAAMFNSFESLTGIVLGSEAPATSSRTNAGQRGVDRGAGTARQGAEITSTGTGFFVDARGRLLTNAHVVEGCNALTVGDGLPAELLALDGNADLALLRAPVSPTDGVARFSARPARLNADVTVVGFPLYGLLGGLNVTRGSVSSTSGLGGDDDYFQMSAAVQPGNSGGPVVNEYGAVVGVVQSKLDAISVASMTGDIPQNINFAIRAELAKLFLNKHSVDFEIEANQVRVEPWALADDAKRYTVLISCWNG